DEHLVPDPDSHRRAFLGVDRLTAEVLLIQAHIEDVAASDPIYQRRLPAELEPEKVQSGLIEDQGHFPEQHVDLALALLHHRVKAEGATKGSNYRSEYKWAKETDGNSDQEFSHDSPQGWRDGPG